jgi:hypothetical protein
MYPSQRRPSGAPAPVNTGQVNDPSSTTQTNTNPYHRVPATNPASQILPFNCADPFDDPFVVSTPSTPVERQFDQNSVSTPPKKRCCHLRVARKYQNLPGPPGGMNSSFGHPGHREFDRMMPGQGGYSGSYHGGTCSYLSLILLSVEILIYGLIHFTLFHQSVVVALHYDSIMSYYSS